MSKSLSKRLFSNTVLLVFSLFFAYVVFESFFRLSKNIPLKGTVVTEEDGTGRIQTFRRSKNDTLLYEPIPGVVSKYKGVENRINSFGMRDKERSLKKRDGVIRIAVLGDSVTWGFGVEVEDAFPRKLEVELNKSSNKEFEVLNFSVPGYDAVQELELYRTKVQQFDPDLVIIAYVLNDFQGSSWEAPLFIGTYLSIFGKSYAFEHLSKSIERYFSGYTDRKNKIESSKISNIFSRFKDEIAANQPTAIVLFPYLVDDHWYSYDYERVKALAKWVKIPLLDLRKTFELHSQLSLRLPQEPHDELHPGPTGHQLAAETVRDFLYQSDFFGLSSLIQPTESFTASAIIESN